MTAALYHGTVVHHRLRPRPHRLRYRVFWLALDLDDLDDPGNLRLFSRNRFNLFGFHDRDYGAGGDDYGAHVRSVLADHGVAADGRLVALCFPRVLGYVFNPLTVVLVHDRAGAIVAVLYEVSNTFGQRHAYLIPGAPGSDGLIRQGCAKQFYVSPFIPMTAHYRFRVLPPGERVAVAIHESDAEGPLLHASFAGRREALTDRALIRAFLRYPMMTAKVMAGIHWEALGLWRKGAPFHRRPPPPDRSVTLVTGDQA